MATILCIDDHLSVLESHRAVLESRGYRVLTALDGPSGIALALKHSVDAVLLDFSMPGMDGSQVAQVLMKERPTLPVVICSGCLDEIPESLRWFAMAVLHKSDGPAALLSTVDTIVSGTGKKLPVRTHRNVTVESYSRRAKLGERRALG